VLRILHKLPRFSEDLDFILQKPDPKFDWGRYLQPLVTGLTEFGLKSEVIDKSKMDRNIRQAQLNLRFSEGKPSRTLRIKLEIDINPPEGSTFDYTYLDFPSDFEVCHQDLPSNFALKIHALLCRPYLKGREWYDFNWYMKHGIQPNLPLLQAALDQMGPWKGQCPEIDAQWVIGRLNEKIAGIDWKNAAADVERFLGPVERESLKLWNPRFFSSKAAQLGT
jgi:hypothetical protein